MTRRPRQVWLTGCLAAQGHRSAVVDDDGLAGTRPEVERAVLRSELVRRGVRRRPASVRRIALSSLSLSPRVFPQLVMLVRNATVPADEMLGLVPLIMPNCQSPLPVGPTVQR